jgi:hypothetical protein
MKRFLVCCVLSMMVAGGAVHAADRFAAGWDLDLETGYVSSGYNNVRIPGDSGTKISLTDDLTTAGKMYYRVRLTKDIGKNNFLSLLYAPLTLDAAGTIAGDVNFNGDLFTSGSRLTGTYRFDSYRATWYKAFAPGGKFSYKLGFTAKIRDAAVTLSDGSITSEKKNTGFVPLLHFGAAYAFTDTLSVLLDGDALAGGPGRAEDVLLAGAWKAGDRYTFRLGYRFVEGGADTDEVYSFALLNYLSAAVIIAF